LAIEHAECFIVRDAIGQALADVYFEGELGGRSSQRVTSRFSGGATPIRICVTFQDDDE